MFGCTWIGRRSGIFSMSWKNTLLIIILAGSLNVFSNVVLSDFPLVHAQGSGIDYTLANTGNVTLAAGNTGSTSVLAFYAGGMNQSVTLACDPTTLPSGATCSFTPSSVLPTRTGNLTLVTVTVPSDIPDGTFNVTVNGIPTTSVPTVFGLIVATKIAVNPTASGSLSATAGSPVTIGLNITNIPNIPPTGGSGGLGGFTVAVFYNKAVLSFQNLDYTNNVFGSDVFVSSECADGLDVAGSGNACSPQKEYDGAGVVSLAMVSNSGKNYAVNGTLYKITFQVLKSGFSSFHVVFQLLENSTGFTYPTAAYDGYFTNENCGSGNLCRPPTVTASPPSKLVTGRAAEFIANAFPQNPKSNITAYNWNWRSGVDVHYYTSTPFGFLGSKSNISFIFPQIGLHTVTLEVVDNYTADAYYTLNVQVIRIWTDLGIASVVVDHTSGVLPGTTVHLTAKAVNNGVNPVNSTFRLSINNQNLTTSPIVDLAPALEASMSYNWTTTNVTPRVYRIEVHLDEVTNATTGQVLENDTSIVKGKLFDANNLDVLYVQLIAGVPSGFGLFLGLNLPETLGVGIILLAVVVFAAGLVRKARKHPEPL